jgi:hypothetical protein
MEKVKEAKGERCCDGVVVQEVLYLKYLKYLGLYTVSLNGGGVPNWAPVSCA